MVWTLRIRIRKVALINRAVCPVSFIDKALDYGGRTMYGNASQTIKKVRFQQGSSRAPYGAWLDI